MYIKKIIYVSGSTGYEIPIMKTRLDIAYVSIHQHLNKTWHDSFYPVIPGYSSPFVAAPVEGFSNPAPLSHPNSHSTTSRAFVGGGAGFSSFFSSCLS